MNDDTARLWRRAIPYLLILAVFVWTVRQQAEAQAEDARIERRSLRAFCEDSNKRTALIRDFIRPSLTEPRPEDYEWITDPELRQGAMEQAARGRAAMRARVEDVFKDRHCDAEFPAPPDN